VVLFSVLINSYDLFIDTVMFAGEVSCNGEEFENYYVQLLYAECDDTLTLGEDETFYLVWAEENLEELEENGNLNCCQSYVAQELAFEIGSIALPETSSGIIELEFEDSWLIIGENDEVEPDPSLEEAANYFEHTKILNPDNIKEGQYLWLVYVDGHEDPPAAAVLDSFDPSSLTNSAPLAKRKYDFWSDGVDGVEWEDESYEEWEIVSNPDACDVHNNLDPDESFGNMCSESTEQPETTEQSQPSKSPSVSPVQQTQLNHTSNDSSNAFTSQIWFFIVLFIGGMALCGFCMYFCKRRDSSDSGFIAAADMQEGGGGNSLHGDLEQRGSLILMAMPKKNLASNEGEAAHDLYDGLGNTPSASRVSPSKIQKHREAEKHVNEGLPTGHEIINASKISDRSRYDSEPGSIGDDDPNNIFMSNSRDSEPGSIGAKTDDEVGEIDITSLE